MNFSKSLFFIFIILVVLSPIGFAQQHTLFTQILKKYVRSGLVDYRNLRTDKNFEVYIQQLSAANVGKLSQKEKMAFWINAYNAFTLKVIIDNYPVNSITDLHTGGKVIGFLLGKTVWDKEFFSINGKKTSLNEIEHEILRKMGEPRIHFAIVCASISCPSLRSEAFEAETLEKQLQEEAVNFLNDPSKNTFKGKEKRAFLSKIFDWFDDDFGGNDSKVLTYIARFLPEPLKTELSKNFSQWDISFLEYNWNLNELK